tara:strand:- start:89 stop:1081 length:993 start_codon:yes stop_codon:yes gene_type:complete
MSINLSVVIPHYNDKNLSKLVKSILDEIDFTKRDEIIIIDDNSQFKPKFNNKKIRTILKKKNTGASAARNIGVRYSKNNIIVFLDSDTILVKNGIKKIKKHFRNKKEKILNGYCHYRPINKNFFTEYKGINEYLWGCEQIGSSKNKILNTRIGAIEKNVIIKRKLKFDEKIGGASVEDYKFSHGLKDIKKKTQKGLLVMHKYPSFLETTKKYFTRSYMWLDLLLKKQVKFEGTGGASKKNSLNPIICSIILISLILSLKSYVTISLVLFFIYLNKKIIFFSLRKYNFLSTFFFIIYHYYLSLVIMLGVSFGFFIYLYKEITKKRNLLQKN